MSAPIIDPVRITNFSRTDSELQAFLLFCALVAGKNADLTARLLSRLVTNLQMHCGARVNEGPLTSLAKLDHEGPGLYNFLVANKVGQYGRITSFIRAAAHLNLRECTLEDLLAVPGIGPKTARFFLLHSRPGVDVAVLDVHVLRWLREDCACVDLVPEGMKTPQNHAAYRSIERLYIYMRKAHFPHLTPAEADLLIWTLKSGRLVDEG